MMSMRTAQIVASVEDPSAGPSYSVPALAAALMALGHDVTLHTIAGWRRSTDPASLSGFPLDRYRQHRHDMARLPVLSGLAWSEDLRRAIASLAHECDILHTHGLWLMPNVYPSWCVGHGSARARIVLSPRGMMGGPALRFSAIKKRVFWHLVQRGALARVSMFHATGASEYEEIRALGLAGPVAVIPNGIDLVETSAEGPRPSMRNVLSLGRIHPKKGLDRLLRAWASVAPRHPDWFLRIAGPDEGGHMAGLRALAADLSLTRCTIEGPLYGEDKAGALRDASVFVLPSLNENFAMTVAEALAAGVPVISTKGAPWAGLLEHRCGWWIDHGAETLTTVLDAVLSFPDDELRAMGERGRAWMAKDYGWPGVASRMADAYAWITGKGDRPSCIVPD